MGMLSIDRLPRDGFTLFGLLSFSIRLLLLLARELHGVLLGGGLQVWLHLGEKEILDLNTQSVCGMRPMLAIDSSSTVLYFEL